MYTSLPRIIGPDNDKELVRRMEWLGLKEENSEYDKPSPLRVGDEQ